MYKNKLTLFFPILSLLWLIATVLWGGLVYPEYSHVSQFMSELGATGSLTSTYVNYFGFIPTEILFLLFLATLVAILPKSKMMMLGVGCLAIYGVSLIGGAVFPCDFQCRPEDASLSHALHMAFGAIAYFSAVVGVVLLAENSKQWCASNVPFYSGVSVAALVFILTLNLDPDLRFVGLIQRSAELLLYIWYIIFAFYLSWYSRGSESQAN